MHILPWAMVLLLVFLGMGTALLAKNIFKVVMAFSILQSSLLLLWVLSGSMTQQTHGVSEGAGVAFLILSSATLLFLSRAALNGSRRYGTMDIREMKGHKR